MRFPRKSAGSLGCLLLLALLLYLIYEETHSRVIFGLRDDFKRAVPLQPVPAGIPSLRARDCGVCHAEIYEEWRGSMHAQAYVDPLFQAYWRKDGHIWICLNCHTPLENQQPSLIRDVPENRVERAVRVPNPDYDPELQLEGITCASCHVREGVIEGPFEDSVAPHPTRYHPRFRSTDICFTCHQVPSGPLQFYNGGPCSTFPEFEAGSYYKEGKICQDCHMPEVERVMAIGGPVRKGRKHLWRGGHDPMMVRQAFTTRIVPDPPVFRPGETAEVTLTFTNSGAGHKLPTGDPDRFFTVEFEVTDGKGAVLKRQEHTMGRWIVWKPVIWEVFENRLMPLTARDYAFTYSIPKDATDLTLRTRVQYHILTDQQYLRLVEKFRLTGGVPYRFNLEERSYPLIGVPGPPVAELPPKRCHAG
jgi:hypothetical protein